MSVNQYILSNNTQITNNSIEIMFVDVLILILYGIIFIIGIGGNSLVIYLVSKNKTMRTVTNVFIANMALSDIMICLLSIPFTWISVRYEEWIFGSILCSLVPFSMGVSVYVSTLTSLAIAIDRYFVIVHPFKPRMKLSVTLIVISVIWIVSISISLPLAIYQKFEINDGIGECGEYWPDKDLKISFDISSFILQYIIPFSVITYSYVKVWLALSKRARPNQCREKEQLELKRKRKTNRMLIAMVAIFAVCWMPLNITHLIIGLQTEKVIITQSIFTMAHIIAMSSTIYNPFLYGWLNENFRKEFKSVLPCLFRTVSRFKLAKTEHSFKTSNKSKETKELTTRSTRLVHKSFIEHDIKEKEEEAKVNEEGEKLNNENDFNDLTNEVHAVVQTTAL